MMVSVYRTFSSTLTHDLLFQWHAMLTQGRQDLHDIGQYRTYEEPMQIISGAIGCSSVHFEAPPSHRVPEEMSNFIAWFDKTAPGQPDALPTLTRAGIAHLYFVCIHPFEDGNGRIGRAIVAKSLSQNLNNPTLIATSLIIHKYKKRYYNQLELNNKSLTINSWLVYFAKTILEAQLYTFRLIEFLLEKAKLYEKIKGCLNPRQEKVITHMLKEGPEGFQGGLSAENYIRITETSRATSTRDLHHLVDQGVLTRTGDLKSTRYYLNIKLTPISQY